MIDTMKKNKHGTWECDREWLGEDNNFYKMAREGLSGEVILLTSQDAFHCKSQKSGTQNSLHSRGICYIT